MNDISELIIGHLRKSLNQKEEDEFYKWVNENQENKKLFFEAKAIYDALSDNTNWDMNDSWQRLLSKREAVHSRVKIIPLWKQICKYAAVASVAILLTSTFFLFNGKHEHDQPSPEYIAGDGIQSDMIVLPDGTKVNIGMMTNFRYASDYGKKDRIVYLEGEAFFDVAKCKDKPFIVKVKGQEIEALGTKFNVMAYTSDSIYTTTLLEGLVSLTSENASGSTILKPDQQFVYNKKIQTGTVNEVESSLYVAWINGYYYFPDQSLKSILNRLSNLYGIRFEVNSERLLDKKFTGTFYKGQSVKNILEIINLSIPIKYRVEDMRVIIEEMSNLNIENV